MVGPLVYGSHARGDFGPDSDVDVAVVLQGGRNGITRDVNKDMLRGTHAAARAHRFLVSPIVLWEDELSDAAESGVTGFLDNVLREAIEW